MYIFNVYLILANIIYGINWKLHGQKYFELDTNNVSLSIFGLSPVLQSIYLAIDYFNYVVFILVRLIMKSFNPDIGLEKKTFAIID